MPSTPMPLVRLVAALLVFWFTNGGFQPKEKARSGDVKDLVKGFVRWLIIVFVTLNIIVWSVAVLRCQTHEKHDNQADLEDDIRIKSVVFLNVDKDTVYFKRETKYRVDLGSFVFDSQTKWDRSKPTPSCMIALYCITHHYLYAFYPCKGG